MRILYLVFAVLLLVSMAAPGYGQKKICRGRCVKVCSKLETPSYPGYDCKLTCCVPIKKGK